MAKQLSETELGAIISSQISLAKDHDKSEREESRSKALDYYMGNMDKYVPPEPNRSKVVSRDVADTIGWMLPGIMRVFTASDRMAEAEPVGMEDIAYAKQATDGMNHVFWKDNKGYEIVYAATWDSLVTGNGIIKTYYDDTPVYATSFHSGLNEDQVAMLLQPSGDDSDEDDAVEVLARTDELQPVGVDEMGQPITQTFTDIKIRRKKFDGRIVIEAIPPEDFLIDQDATSTDEAAFTAHWQRLTRSALVAMGYDRSEVGNIPEAGRADTAEDQAREENTNGDAPDASMQLVDYYECFVRVDVDGDGEAELVRVCYGGGENGQVLDWEVWEDEHPFDDIPCEPIPHRWDARSVADETIDIQDVKTVLTRQLLNNTYWVNNPQRFAQGKIRNPEQLTDPEFGGTVFGDAGAMITDLTVPYIGDKALSGIGYMDEVAQRRTGVGKQSMALDAESLQNQTATANQNQRDASYSQIELIARNMAEWGWRKVFRKLMRLMIKHQDYSRTLMVAGKPVEIDPRHWNADMDVTINVGLGTGSRDRDLAMLNNVLGQQIMLTDRLAAGGFPDKALDMLPFIHNTLMKATESAGLKNPEAYFPEVTEDDIQAGKQRLAEMQQKGDPKVQAEQAKMQADMQMSQAKMQGDMQMQQAKLQSDTQQGQERLQLDAQKMQMEFQLKREQIAAEMGLKREQLNAELLLKREQMMAELQLKRELGVMGAAAKVEASTSEVNMGGEPG